ncbi:hypothetical protein SAMN04487910_2997 [Aquimarina amphilecti]|uniref:DUF3575 domain-containing protein n=2 Tax=Aquimarina amphilecti TaxID=1038014 RepID=A0A1H7S596_AQUAM|nr:hypothetical protein SAMN04487910_2997 [Aquimarina amphilecti]
MEKRYLILLIKPFKLMLSMRKVVFVLLLFPSPYFGFSQNIKEASVEKSVFGIQLGILNLWVHHELKLSNQVVLRSEIGIGGPNTANIAPALALEPRWYYNLNGRANRGKRIDGNSGNYVSFRSSYHFYNVSEDDKNSLNNLLLAPTWGIRRNIGNHFNYEAGLGLGLGFGNDRERGINTIPYVSLKIGYRF